MFVLCPHCHFLVAVDPRTGRPPATCPKCNGALDPEQAAQADAGAPVESIPPAPIEPPPVTPAEWSAPTPLMPPAPEPDALSEAIATMVADDARPAQLTADALIAAMATKTSRRPRTKSEAASTDTAPTRRARRKRAETPPATEPPPAPVAKKPERAAGPPISQRFATWLAAMKPKPKAKPAGPTSTATVAPPKPVEPPKRKASVKPIASLRDRAKAKAAAEADAAPAIEPVAVEPVAVEPVAVEPVAIEPVAVEPVAVEPVATEPDTTDLGTIEPVPAEPLAIEHIVEDVIAPVVATPVPEHEPVLAPLEARHIPASTVKPVEDLHVAPKPAARPRAATHAPSFARTRSGGFRAIAAQGPVSSEWIRAGSVGALALLLGLQLLLAQSDTLAANARWRPTVNALCGVFRCTLPAWRQPEAFTMLARDVRPHPRAAGTLQIDASFRNDARWPQAWPLLVVSLSDIDGRIVGTRAFSAHEYLGADATQNTLAPGQTAAISLAVVEPAPGIVAFSFDFR